MRIVSVAVAKANLSAYLNATDQGPVVVTRNGRPKAVLLPITDEEDLERLLLAYSPKLRAILDAARQRIQKGAGIENDEFWREVATGKAGGKKGKPRRKTA